MMILTVLFLILKNHYKSHFSLENHWKFRKHAFHRKCEFKLYLFFLGLYTSVYFFPKLIRSVILSIFESSISKSYFHETWFRNHKSSWFSMNIFQLLFLCHNIKILLGNLFPSNPFWPPEGSWGGPLGAGAPLGKKSLRLPFFFCPW